MRQSRLMSLVEAAANVLVGYGLAVLTQLLVFPWFGLPARVGDTMAIGGVFMLVSLGRSYRLLRLFERWRGRTSTRNAAGGRPRRRRRRPSRSIEAGQAAAVPDVDHRLLPCCISVLAARRIGFDAMFVPRRGAGSCGAPDLSPRPRGFFAGLTHHWPRRTVALSHGEAR